MIRRRAIAARRARTGSAPALAALAVVACNAKPAPSPSPAVAPPAASSAPAPAQAGGGVPCGPMRCAQYDTPAAAFLAAIEGAPRIVAVGEAHAPKGAKAPSSARRFTEEILPLLAGRASDLVVELMKPPTGCAPRVAEVREAQAPVTARQAATDQDEYLAMGEAARRLGVVPDLLRPTCADLDAISAAGDDAVDASLRTIARLTAEKVKKLAERDRTSAADASKMVLSYGGAIHNDREPTAERRAWSFGPELDAYAGGRYVAVDVYVPEFIDGSELWTKQPWYTHYDAARMGDKATLFTVGERSYVLIMPRQGGAPPPP